MPDNIGYQSALKEQAWRAGITLEAERATNLMALAGKDEYDAFYIHYGGERGDQLTHRFSRLSRRAPKTLGDPVLGHEAGTEKLEDSLFLRYFLLDGAIENTVASQQLVSFDEKDLQRSLRAREWGELWEQWIINQLVGNTHADITGAADYGYSGGNALVAPDASHWYFAPDSLGTNANEAAVAADATSVMTSDVIDELVTRSTSKAYVEWPMTPCNTPFGQLFVMGVHGRGFKQIKENTAASDIYDIARAKIEGGGSVDSNELITGEGFIYNKTLVLRSDFCPATIANARRGFFIGAGALDMRFGEGYTDGEHLGYAEQTHLPRRWSFIVDTVAGMKVRIPQEPDTADNQRFGCYVFSHYSDV